MDAADRRGALLMPARIARSASIAALLAAAGTSGATAQALPWDATAAAGGSGVYLVTIGPGRPVWTRFGHSALVIADGRTDLAVAYNYGMFSFEQEHFVLRFLQGRMRYWMNGFPAAEHVREHVAQDRTLWVQELALTSAQRDSLARFLAWNARPEHRYYRYDYYLDNCATRIRDALDRVLGGRIRAQTDTASATDPTYRFHTRRAFAGAPLVYAGTQLALGQPVDRRTTPWEEMWLPEAMQRHLRRVTVVGDDGTTGPLVRSEQTLYVGAYRLPDEPSDAWTAGALVAALALGIAVIAAVRRWERSRGSRLLAFGVVWTWTLLSGTLGLVALALWTLTDHWATAWNENLLQFDPLALGLVALLPLAFRGGVRRRRLARIIAVAIAAGSVVGALAQVMPWCSQVNGPIVAAGVPFNLALAAFAIRLEADDPAEPSPPSTARRAGP